MSAALKVFPSGCWASPSTSPPNSWCYTAPWAYPEEAALRGQSCHTTTDHFRPPATVMAVTQASVWQCWQGSPARMSFPHLCVLFHTILAFPQKNYVHLLPMPHCTRTQSRWQYGHDSVFLMLPRGSLRTWKFESTCSPHLTEFLIKSFHHLYL